MFYKATRYYSVTYAYCLNKVCITFENQNHYSSIPVICIMLIVVFGSLEDLVCLVLMEILSLHSSSGNPYSNLPESQSRSSLHSRWDRRIKGYSENTQLGICYALKIIRWYANSVSPSAWVYVWCCSLVGVEIQIKELTSELIYNQFRVEGRD